MRLLAKSATVLILMGVVCSGDPFSNSPATAQEATKEKMPRKLDSGTKITLKPRKTKYFLGENILLDYQISYDGDGRFAFDSTLGLGTYDCTVIATDQAGNQAVKSTRIYRCGGSGGSFIGRGETISFTIPLSYYCRLEKPGTYRIRAAHNLNWSEGAGADRRLLPILKDDPRWAETTIELAMPTEAQARKVVEEMCRLKPSSDRHAHPMWYAAEYADFTCLQQPIYLPILEKMAADKMGDKRAHLGITHNPTPEATEALLRLLKDADEDRTERITAALCDRLPKPQGINRTDRENPIARYREYRDTLWIHFEDADPKLMKGSWRSDLATPMRQFARKLLSDDNPMKVQIAAYIYEAIGTREDVPDLTAKASKIIPEVEKAELPQYHGEIAPIRQACMDVGYAIEAMAARGIEPVSDPKTPGEIMHFILMVKRQKTFRPAGWEKRCLNWVRNETPYVREFVLFNSPHPLPDSLLEPYRDAVRKVIGTTREPIVLHTAVQCAVDLKIPLDELLGRLIDRLDAKVPMLHANLYNCVEDLLETGKHGRAGAGCSPFLGEEEVASAKGAWKKFLKDNGQAIRDGKHFRFMQWPFPKFDDEP